MSMTENEAIKIFKEIYNTDKHTEDEKAESIRIVIDKWNGVYEKISAIDVLFALQYVMDIAKKFESIGTIEEFKVWKEKNKAKKVVDNGEELLCPSCGYDLTGRINEQDHDPYYCFECGQALDWERKEKI